MEEFYEVAFSVIMHAGDSRGYSTEAVTCAENGDFEGAQEKIRAAEEELKQAHLIQTDMMQKEACGDHIPLSMLIVHAQDHYSMAQVQHDMSQQMIKLYQKIYHK